MPSLWDEQEPKDDVAYTEFQGVNLRMKWRSHPNFRDEARLLRAATDQETRLVDHVALLAGVVRDFVEYIEEEDEGEWKSLGLTPSRIQTEIPERPNIAWKLIEWVCGEILEHADPKASEVVQKKSGTS